MRIAPALKHCATQTISHAVQVKVSLSPTSSIMENFYFIFLFLNNMTVHFCLGRYLELYYVICKISYFTPKYVIVYQDHLDLGEYLRNSKKFSPLTQTTQVYMDLYCHNSFYTLLRLLLSIFLSFSSVVSSVFMHLEKLGFINRISQGN